MSDNGESEGYHSAILFSEAESDQDPLYLPDNFDESSDDDDNYVGSDIEIEMDPKKWALQKVETRASERAIVFYNPEIQKLLEAADEIKRARIKQETRVQYNNANVVYVNWLFHNFKNQFYTEYLNRMNEAYLGGQNVALIEEISKIIIVEEEFPIDPSSFLMTFKNSDGHYFSFSTYDGKRSALMHMMKFDERHVIRLKEMDELKKMMTGLCKSIIQQKKDLGLTVSEGKDSLSFEGCKLTCELMMKESTCETRSVKMFFYPKYLIISQAVYVLLRTHLIFHYCCLHYAH